MWTWDWCILQQYLSQRHFCCSKLAQKFYCLGNILISLQSKDVKFIKFTHATHKMGKCDSYHIPTCMLVNKTSLFSHMSPTHPRPHPTTHCNTHGRYRRDQQDSWRYRQKLHRCWWTLVCFTELASTWKCALRNEDVIWFIFSHSPSFIDRICIFNFVLHQQKLNVPQFSYGHGKCTFVDTSIEYLLCYLICVRYWVRSSQQNTHCTRTQT